MHAVNLIGVCCEEGYSIEKHRDKKLYREAVPKFSQFGPRANNFCGPLLGVA